MKISQRLFLLTTGIFLCSLMAANSSNKSENLHHSTNHNGAITLELAQQSDYMQQDIDFVCTIFGKEQILLDKHKEDFSQYNFTAEEELAKKIDTSADLKFKKYKELYTFYNSLSSFPSKNVRDILNERKLYIYYRYKAAECLKNSNFSCSKAHATNALQGLDKQNSMFNRIFQPEGIRKLTNQCGFNLNRLK